MTPQPPDEGAWQVEPLPPDRPYLILVPTEEGGVVRILGLIEVAFQQRPGPRPGEGDRWEAVLVISGTGPEGGPVTLYWPADQLDRLRLLPLVDLPPEP